MSFLSLGLHPALIHAVHALGLDTPTPIQSMVIGPVLRQRDVLAMAPTGSGKTVAYALPLLARLYSHNKPFAGYKRHTQALVLVPTRELAIQVGDVLQALCAAANNPAQRAGPAAPSPRIAVLFGGVSINPQMMALRGGADIVVATPGRLLDIIEHNALTLQQVGMLVLDEADRLLDTEFAQELEKILALLPAQRQTILFSATFSPEAQAAAYGLLNDPVTAQIEAQPVTTDGLSTLITQRAITVDEKKRTQLLRQLLQDPAWSQVLVFVGTQYTAEHVAEKLYKAGIFATPFHGGLSQGARTQVLQELKDQRWQVVVTTDLASRGIDISQLPIVVNYDLPRSANDYTHRIGRTGRAGASGIAVSFVPAAALSHWGVIVKRQSLDIELEIVPGFEPSDPVPTPSAETLAGTGGIKGKRPSKKDKLRAAAAANSGNQNQGNNH